MAINLQPKLVLINSMNSFFLAELGIIRIDSILV